MAWSKSGLYALTFRDALNATNLAVDHSLSTHKWALYDNSITPAFDSETAYATTGECAASGDYATGGKVITTPTFAVAGATAVLTYDMVDQAWTTGTTVTAYGGKLYLDALAGNNLLVGMYFGGPFTSTAGTFTIQFAGTGVYTVTFAP